MKSISIAKYNLFNCKRRMITYYAIFSTVCIALVILNSYGNGSMSASGTDMATAVFLFVLGIHLFKESFYFSQSNNISRKTYFKGTILSIIPIAAIASLLDLIINRVFNLFTKCPNNYDMIFTKFRDIDTTIKYTSNGSEPVILKGRWDEWVQANNLTTLANNYLFQISLYIMLIVLGLTIALIYYRCNKLMKTILTVSPFLILIVINSLGSLFKTQFNEIGLFIQNILGWNTRNPYAAICTFIIIFIILTGCAYLLVKKTVIKER